MLARMDVQELANKLDSMVCERVTECYRVLSPEPHTGQNVYQSSDRKHVLISNCMVTLPHLECLRQVHMPSPVMALNKTKAASTTMLGKCVRARRSTHAATVLQTHVYMVTARSSCKAVATKPAALNSTMIGEGVWQGENLFRPCLQNSRDKGHIVCSNPHAVSLLASHQKQTLR
jgi:hypothetical protein